MKRLVIAAAAGFIALSGAASAMTSSVFEGDLASVAPSVDASTLTEAQVTAIKQVLFGGDSASEQRSQIYSIVNG